MMEALERTEGFGAGFVAASSQGEGGGSSCAPVRGGFVGETFKLSPTTTGTTLLFLARVTLEETLVGITPLGDALKDLFNLEVPREDSRLLLSLLLSLLSLLVEDGLEVDD